MKRLTGSGIILCAVTLVLNGDPVQAEDLTTRSGKVLKDFDVLYLDADSMTVAHREGTTKIPLSELPLEIQKRYTPNELLQQLRRKTAELESLKRELAAVRGLAVKSAQAAERSDRIGSSGSPPPAVVTAKPIPPASTLPPLRPGDNVTVEEISHHYRTDSRAADGRYRKKTFRIRGRVERFEERPFVRKTAVLLESPERSERIVCEMPFAEEFNAVFSTKGGQVLVGVTQSRREVHLMEIGESVVFQGQCMGLRNGAIVFSNCVPIR